MSEKVTQGQRRKLAVAAGIGLAGLSLAGCTNAESNAQMRQGISVAARYDYDYVNGLRGYGNTDSTNNERCLATTAYRTNNVAIIQAGTDQVAVQAPGNLSALHFDGLMDLSKPLQPADSYTTKVLEAAGCHLKTDGEVYSTEPIN